MKIVFFGSGKFAVKILETLVGSGQHVVLVVTQPDRKKGRHLHLTPTPVKEFASAAGLRIFQPENVNAPENIAVLKENPADIYLVVSYGRILSGEVLSSARLMPVNIHASLLPKYRGAAPINRALMDGVEKTGVTFIKMNEQMDQGDILFMKSLKISPADNVVSLDGKLSDLAALHADHVLKSIERGRAKTKKQIEKNASLAPLMKKSDGRIDWNKDQATVINQSRGCAGWPGVFTTFRGKLLKILEIRKGRSRSCGMPGQIIGMTHGTLEVACGRGSIIISQVLPESHVQMSVQSFLAGHEVQLGEFLGG